MRYRRRLRRARYPTGRSESSTPGEFIFLSIVWAIRTTGKCFVHRLDQQREAFEDKQRDATSSTIADDLDAKCRELEELDRKLQRLRSEQDRAAAAGEGALKLRLKREELFAKEERMAALLAAKRPAMRDVFGGDADVPVSLFF